LMHASRSASIAFAVIATIGKLPKRGSDLMAADVNNVG